MRELLRRILIVENEDEEAALIGSLVRCDQTLVVSFFNQNAFNLAFSKPAFRTALASSHLLLRDGVGIEICLTLMGQKTGRNLNGTDLIPRVLSALGDRRVAVFGTSDPWLAFAVAEIQARGVHTIASVDGFRPIAEYVNAVKASDPHVILLGMGMPSQELLATELARLGGRPRLIINGGAILDFYGKRFPRAPSWMRRRRIEWLYRFSREPRRLAGRYLVGGIVFGWRLFLLWHMQRFEEKRTRHLAGRSNLEGPFAGLSDRDVHGEKE